MSTWLTRSGYRNSVDAGELLSWTLLDHDVSSALQTQIAGRAGRRHVKRYTVMLGSDGQLIRAHFVGRVAVGNNPVRSDDDSCVCTRTLTSDTPDTVTTLIYTPHASPVMPFSLMASAAMLSVMRVAGNPSATASYAVSRAPWL